MKILMVCLGNICRSPMAEGILQHMARQADLDWLVDSAGTGSWHIGEQPDARAIATCARRGLDIRDLRARQFHTGDFDRFDLILTMDNENHRQVMAMAQSGDHQAKIKPIMSFSNMPNAIVPDPYYDGKFDEVYNLLSSVCSQIIEHMGSASQSS